MKLKYQLDADEHSKLDEGQQGLYEQDGEGYRLAIDGLPEPPNVDGLKAKNAELMDEAKKAKDRARQIEEETRAAEEARQKEQGEFKSLYERTQEELESHKQTARQFREQVQAKELDGAATKLAGSLTRDSKRAELLAKEARQFAEHTEDGVQFQIGGIPVEPEKVAEKIKEAYPFLVDGDGATGGGATGANRGGASAVTIERSDFDQMNSVQKREFLAKGGRLTD